MNETGRTIAKNMGAMMGTQLVTWLLSFILSIFLPRYLGASAVGEIAVAASVWTIASVLIAFGMDTHLTKMIARDPAHMPDLLGTSLTIRTIFFLIACILVTGYLYLFNFNSKIVYIAIIIGVSTIIGVYSATLSSVFVGLERMEFNSLSSIVSKTFLTVLTLLLIFMHANIYAIVALSIVTGSVSLSILIYALKRQYALRMHVTFADAWAMLRMSTPYLITSLVIAVYVQIDQIFIATMVDTRTVGWYSTATNLFGTSMFLPVAIGTTLLPVLSRSYTTSQHQLQHIARRSFDLMFLISVPIGFGIIVIANPLVIMLYGSEFAQSGPVLAVLGSVLIFMYLNTLLGQLLISTDRTSKWNLVMTGGVLLTLPLDLVLVPWTRDTYGNGALGGTIAFLFTEFWMVVGAILLLPKNTIQWSNVRTAALSLFAGLVMIATSWWWRETLMPLSILVGAVTYIGLVFLLRIVSHEDLLLLKELGSHLVRRFRRTPKVAPKPNPD